MRNKRELKVCPGRIRQNSCLIADFRRGSTSNPKNSQDSDPTSSPPIMACLGLKLKMVTMISWGFGPHLFLVSLESHIRFRLRRMDL